MPVMVLAMTCLALSGATDFSPPPLVTSEPSPSGKPLPSAPPLVMGEPQHKPHAPSLEQRIEAQAIIELEPEPPPVAAPVEEGRVVSKIGIGLAHRGLYEVPYWGIQLDLYLGKAARNGAHYFDLLGFYGVSRAGLPTGDIRVGYTAEGRLGRFRLGAGPQTALLIMRRVTTGQPIVTLGVGLRGHVTFDVTDPAPDAKVLYVALTGGGAFYASGALMYDVGLGFGLRI